jgi:hypothetical protein
MRGLGLSWFYVCTMQYEYGCKIEMGDGYGGIVDMMGASMSSYRQSRLGKSTFIKIYA